MPFIDTHNGTKVNKDYSSLGLLFLNSNRTYNNLDIYGAINLSLARSLREATYLPDFLKVRMSVFS